MRLRSPCSSRKTTPRALVVLGGIAGALLAAGLFACDRPPNGAGSPLVITGSSTIAPLVSELAQRYERDHPGVRIDVQAGGSSRGIEDVRSGLAQIGMVSRALKDDERSLVAYPIARDGVAIIVHARNPVDALDRRAVRALYRGEIESWAQLGGRDAAPVIVHKAAGRATLEVFLAYFGLAADEVEADVIAGENEHAIKTVAGNPDAVGYVSIGTAVVDIEHGVPIKRVASDGIAATLENVRNGRFPIVRPLNLVTREPATGLALRLIEFLRTPGARPIYSEQAFVQVVE